MPRVIFKCPYLKGGSPRAAAHLENLVGYIATRDGAERIDPGNTLLAATRKQKELVTQLVQSFPESKELFEYEDYLAAPNRGNASAFITMAIEQNLTQLVHREKYLEYIAKRPRTQRFGTHGLFTGDRDSLVLSQVAETVATHPGNVWLPIISLRREDAARLGYDNAENWRSFLSSYAMQMAEAMKIPWEQFRWYAAFHNESHHPHIHMVCYSVDPSKGFLTRNGIAQIKSGLAKHIFRQELTALYAQQTQSRDTLTQDAGEVMAQLIAQMQNGILENSRIEQLAAALAQRLRFLSGKKQYGYLKAPMKSLVDEIVDELAKDPRVDKAYALWYEQREEVLRTYRDTLPARLPLSRQQEFKKIRNMVIQEALRLGELSQVFLPDGDKDNISIPEEAPVTEGPGEEPPDEADQQEADSQFTVDWSKRYKEARSFLYGSDAHPLDHGQALALFQAEALAGNALAMHDLGRMLAAGLGCAIDAGLSQEWYAKALAAFQSIERAKPDRYVEYRIGKLYAAGLGTEQDYGQAAQWLALSAGQGYKYAQYSLAGLYRRGQGVEQNDEEAQRLYTNSAKQGFPYACYELGKMYRDGAGCNADERQSAEYFRQAFSGFYTLEERSHDDKLQHRIGWMLLHGVGVEKNEAAARTWFEKAAHLGNPYAQYQLAKLILADQGADAKQLRQALEWLTEAAEAGQDPAQYTLGKIYRDGIHGEKDIHKAMEYFKQAAEQDNSFAAYALAKLLLDADGEAPENAVSALVWLRRSAELKNQFAQYRLGKLLLQGELAPKNVEEALRWLTASAEQGNQFAQYALGKFYLLGKEVPRDRDTASRWLSLAAAQGNEYAKYFLDHMDDRPAAPLFLTATRLLHHLGNIFQEQEPPRQPGGMRIAIDRKLLRKIREKKAAQGHKWDDHEPSMTL